MYLMPPHHLPRLPSQRTSNRVAQHSTNASFHGLEVQAQRVSRVTLVQKGANTLWLVAAHVLLLLVCLPISLLSGPLLSLGPGQSKMIAA